LVAMYICMYVCVCMYICIYVCMYVYMCVCMYICMHVCMYVLCMYICVYVYMCVCMYVCIYVCMCYVCIYVCMCICVCVCMYVLLYVCIYLGIFVYTPTPHFGSPVDVMHPSHLLLRTLIHHNSFRGNFWKSGYLKDKTWEVNIDMDLGTMICEAGGDLSRSCFCQVVSGGGVNGVEKLWHLQSIQ